MLLYAAQSRDHIIERLHQRGHGLSIEQLSAYLAEINQYMPDDWRMKVNKNSFIVRVQSEIPINLVGFSYLARNQISTFHFIHSALKIEYDDLKDIPAGVEIPNVCRPNLYYFRKPFPYAGHSSPLWARQGEKYKEGEELEYHRIKPLTQKGIISGIQIWVQFHTGNGTITRVPEPPKDTHGRSYWMLHKESDLSKPQKERLDRYREELINLQIDPHYEAPQTEGKLEYKYIAPVLFDQTIFQGLTDYSYTGKHKLILQDTYLDTEQKELQKRNISLRLRQVFFKNKSYYFVDMKKGEVRKKKRYKRDKDSWSISPHRAEKILKRNEFSYPISSVVSYLLDDVSALAPIAYLDTQRIIFTLQQAQTMARVEVRLDSTKYSFEQHREDLSGHEVEIQSMSDTTENTALIANWLRDQLGLQPAQGTKLERAFQLELRQT